MNVPAPPSPPALVAGFRRAVVLAPDGAARKMTHAEAAEAIAALPAAIVCHGPATARRLGIAPFAALDILELFAFTRPAVPADGRRHRRCARLGAARDAGGRGRLERQPHDCNNLSDGSIM